MRLPALAAMLFLLAAACTAEVPPSGAEQESSQKVQQAQTAQEERVPAAVERLKVRVLRSYPHDPSAYTQGLLYEGGGKLLESTGLRGASSLRRVDLETGRVLQEETLDRSLFGEGLAKVGERLYQLTWQAELGMLYRADSFAPEGQFHYQGEGWGLCYNGQRLIMSNGSARLSFREPETFQEVGGVEVRLEGRLLANLNELECVDGSVYANVYGTQSIVRIDPADGRVTALIDASGLLSAEERAGAEVLNGIAHDASQGIFYITGKLWPRLFAVEFVSP